MNLAIQLRQSNIKPQTAIERHQLVWFLVNHVEFFTDRIEFSGPEECGSISIIEDNFLLPPATINKYGDVTRQYDFCTVHDAASALNWPAHLRIDTPNMNDDPKIPESIASDGSIELPQRPKPFMPEHAVDDVVIGTRTDSTGILVVMLEKDSRKEIASVLVESFEGRRQVHIYQGEDDEPNQSIELPLSARSSSPPETEADRLGRIVDVINASTHGLVAELWHAGGNIDTIHIRSTTTPLHFVWGTCNECWGADVYINEEAWNKSACDEIGVDTGVSSDIYTPDLVGAAIIAATLRRIKQEKPFTDRVIKAATLLNREPEISAEVNWTEPDHAGRMEIMGFRPPFYFVFDYPDEAVAAKGGAWRARVWLKPAEESPDNPAHSSKVIAPKDATAEALADACREYMAGFRLNPAIAGRMTAKLYNSDNYPTLEAAIADKGWVGNTEDVSGFSNILDTLLNMKAAAEVAGSDDYVAISMRIEVGLAANYIELPDYNLDKAADALNRIFA